MKKSLSKGQVLARSIEERARFYLGKDSERFTVCIILVDRQTDQYILSTATEEGLLVLSSFLQAKDRSVKERNRRMRYRTRKGVPV